MKQMLGLEDHGARELHTLHARLAAKFLALTAAIALTTASAARPATSPPTTPNGSVERLI